MGYYLTMRLEINTKKETGKIYLKRHRHKSGGYLMSIKKVNKKSWIYLRIILVLLTKFLTRIEYQWSALAFLDSYVITPILLRLFTLNCYLSPELDTAHRTNWQDSTIFITDHCRCCYEDWSETNEESQRGRSKYLTGTNFKWDSCCCFLSSGYW